MTALVTHRLPVSPLAHRRRRHVRHLRYVATHTTLRPLSKVRSEKRWSPELSPFLQGPAHKMAASYPQQRTEISVMIEIWETPYLQYFPVLFPHSDILVCGSSLALLVFL